MSCQSFKIVDYCGVGWNQFIAELEAWQELKLYGIK